VGAPTGDESGGDAAACRHFARAVRH
jgi:hypothetical protein